MLFSLNVFLNTLWNTEQNMAAAYSKGENTDDES